MERGKFITFEGIDGAGKTTQIEALQRFLLDHGIEVVRTREPGGTPLGEKIRAMLLNDDMDVTAETLLFFASRAQHIRDVILPAVERGAWVLSDRFTDATYAYQVGAKGYDAENVLQLEARTADRFEAQDCDFFTRVRKAYLARAAVSPERFFVLDADQPPEVITAQLLVEAKGWL